MTNFCGYIAILGRANAGKSTLLNNLLEQKISITSKKKQTTQSQIEGILTKKNKQIIFIDTPGIHLKKQKKENYIFNQVALSAIEIVDIILVIVDATSITKDDDKIFENLKKTKKKIVLVINKIDKIKDKTTLLPHINLLQTKVDFAEILMISALKNMFLNDLLDALFKYLPKNDFVYSENEITTANMRFLASEMIREKIMRLMGDEIPYNIKVKIDDYKEYKNLIKIYACIFTNKESIKPMIIGKGAKTIKEIGKKARFDLQKLTQKKVFLDLFVKIKKDLN